MSKSGIKSKSYERDIFFLNKKKKSNNFEPKNFAIYFRVAAIISTYSIRDFLGKDQCYSVFGIGLYKRRKKSIIKKTFL